MKTLLGKLRKLLAAKWIFTAAILIGFGLWIFWPSGGTTSEPLSAFVKQTAQHQITSVSMNASSHTLEAKAKGGKTYKVEYPSGYEDDLIKQFQKQEVDYKVNRDSSFWKGVLGFLPLLVVFGFWFFMLRGGAGGGMASALLGGKQNFSTERPKVRFSDVKGADEAIADLQLTVEALRDPSNYKGPKIDQGILLHGGTGTGKTLLARALAGEAGVPFYYLSGSQLTSMFVNHSARLVSGFFDDVKKSLKDSEQQAAIVFVDEIDGLAPKRSTHGLVTAGQQEHNTTVTQLLHQIGILFENYPFVVLVAATNLFDSIDEALLRPGRIGKHIPMPKPDILARQHMLELYTKDVSLAEDVDLSTLAQLMSDMSGAKVHEVIAEAQRLAYRDNKQTTLTMDHLRTAVIRVAMGVPRTSAKIDPEDARIAATHESGHAVATLNTKRFTLQHVTIIPIAESGGSTWYTRDDRLLFTREILLEELTVCFGGLAAEEALNPGMSPSVGASHDLLTATNMALNVVCSTSIGGITMTVDPEDWTSHPQAGRINNAVDELLHEAHGRAHELVENNRQFVERLRDALLAEKSLGRDQILEFQEQIAA